MRTKLSLPFLILLLLYSPLIVFSFDIGKGNVAGFAGIVSVMTDTSMAALFFSSIGFAAASSLIALGIGFCVTSIMAKTDIGYAKRFLFLYAAPIAIPPFVAIEAVLFLSELTGRNLFSAVSLVIVTAVVYMPLPVIIIAAGLQSIPRGLEEAGRLSFPGNGWFRKVTLPYLKPYLIGAFIITFVFSFTNYEIPSLMNIRTYTLHIFNQFGAFYDFGKAAVMVQPLFLLLGSMIVLQAVLLGKRSFFDLSPTVEGVTFSLGRAGKAFGFAFLSVVASIVLFPAAVVFSKLAGSGGFPSGIFPVFCKEIGYSFTISALGALVAIGCAVPYVRVMAGSSEIMQRVYSLGSLLPLAIPSSFIAIGLIRLSAAIRFDPAITASIALVWGLAARFFPVVCQVLYAGALSVDPKLPEAASIARRSAWSNFFGIWLPLHASHIGKAFLFFLLLSISEIGLAVLLVPPGCMTASVNIYSMLHYGFGKEVALETLMVLFVAMALGGMVLGLRRKGRAYRQA